MKNTIKIPRVLKIEQIEGFTISCIFNNGEQRDIDFKKLFKKWRLSNEDPEFALNDPSVFKKVCLKNNTLCWKNIRIPLMDMDGKEVLQALEIDPEDLYINSVSSGDGFKKFGIGKVIKKQRTLKGMSQDELAIRSGTSKTYISRVENDKIQPELHTLYKIVEIGLGKKIEVRIY